MFNGIISNIGVVVDCIKSDSEDLLVKILVEDDFRDLSKGESVCCSGICLTVVEFTRSVSGVEMCFNVSFATIKDTNVAYWQKGYLINIERSLLIGSRINGHFIYGHIDCCSSIIDVNRSYGSIVLKVLVNEKFAPLLARKGCIALNGVALTVNDVDNCTFSVNIIPHTAVLTNLGKVQKGDYVNVEFDMNAHYILSMMQSMMVDK